MEIKHRELQKLYTAFIMDRTPQSRKNCPHQKEIINFFKSKLKEKKKLKIIDHVTNCCYCAQEFELILETIRKQEEMNKEIGGIISLEHTGTAIKKRANRDVAKPREKRKISLPILSWKYALPLFGAAVIILSLIILQKSEKREYRDENLVQIKLIEPVNGKHFRSLSVFKWAGLRPSKYYVIEIFDETLYPVWESDRIFKEHYIFPEEIAKQLIKNKTYFWMVTAFLSDGKKVESSLEEFILIN